MKNEIFTEKKFEVHGGFDYSPFVFGTAWEAENYFLSLCASQRGKIVEVASSFTKEGVLTKTERTIR